MDYKSAFDYSALRKSLIESALKIDPDAIKKYGQPPDNILDVIVSRKKEYKSFQERFLYPPEVALKNRQDDLANQIDTILRSKQKNKLGELATPFLNEPGDIAAQYGQDTLDQVKSLIEERRNINAMLRPGAKPATDSPLFGGESPLTLLGIDGKRAISREGIATKGIVNNMISGIANTLIGGLSWGKSKPKSDEEVVAEINYLRENDEFYKTVFHKEVKLGDRDAVEKGFNAFANVVGIAPEFATVKGLIGPVGNAARWLGFLKKNQIAVPYINKIVSTAQSTGVNARIARGVLHSLESAPVFAAHSIAMGRPEGALQSAGSGLAFGFGGGVSKGVGVGLGEWAKGIGGAGVGFALPAAAVELVHGEDIGKVGENAIANFIAGGLLHVTQFQSVDKFKDFMKQTQGLDYDKMYGKEANTEANKAFKALHSLQSDLSWVKLMDLELEPDIELVQKKHVTKEPLDKSINAEPFKETTETSGNPETYIHSQQFMTNYDEFKSVGPINDFVSKLTQSTELDVTAKRKLADFTRDLAGKSISSSDFITNLKKEASLLPGVSLDEFTTSEQQLKQIYFFNKQQKRYGEPGQLNNWALRVSDYMDDKGQQVTNTYLMPIKQYYTNKYKTVPNYEYVSPLAELLGNNLSIVSTFEKDGKEVSLSDMKERDVLRMVDRLQKDEQNPMYALPVKGDGGSLILVKPHANMKDPKLQADALTELSKYVKLEKISDKDFAVNNHFYFKEQLGDNYLEHITTNNKKFANVQELTKRMPIGLSKGVQPESGDFDGLGYEMRDGKYLIPNVILPDDKATQRTDGVIIQHSELFDRTMKSLGAEIHEDSPIGNYKPFIYYKDKDLGAFMGKTKIMRATPEEDARIEQLTGGKGNLIYSSSAKYIGGRKIYDGKEGPEAYRFDITPESMRVLKWEHNKYLDANGESTSHRVRIDRQISYYMDHPFFKAYYDRGARELQDELKVALSSPDTFQKWFKNEVMRIDEDEIDVENDYDNVTQQYLSTADKIFRAFDYSKFSTQMPMNRAYAEKAIYNYIVKSVMQPKINGGVFELSGMPEWVVPMVGDLNDPANRRNIVLGHHASYMNIERLLRKNKLSVELNGKELNGKLLAGRGIKTLGELFAKYPKAAVLVGGDRAPVEDVGGIRSFRIVGIGPKGTGSSAFVHPDEMKYLAGADNDYDTVKIFLEDGKMWQDVLLNKYNNFNYIKDSNDHAEEVVSSGAFSKEINAKMKDINAKDGNDLVAIDGIESLFDKNSYIKVGKSMNNAKTSIGRLMALDRTLRVMMHHGLLKPKGMSVPKSVGVNKIISGGQTVSGYPMEQGTPQQSKPVVQGEEAQVRWRELSGDPQAVEFSKLFPTITKDNIKTATDLVSSKTGLNISKVGNTTGTESKALLARLLVSPETQGTSNVIYGHGVMRNGEWYFRDTNTKVMDYINANYKPGDKVYSVVCDTKKRNFATAEGILLEAGSTKQPTANIPVKDKSVSQIESYDAAMKIWKKAVVDAKHGGLPEWKYVRSMVIDDIFGDGSSDKLFGKLIDKDGKPYDSEEKQIFGNIQSVMNKVFSRNWQENRAWTTPEVIDGLKTYFDSVDPKKLSQLESILNNVPKDVDISIFNDIDKTKLNRFYNEHKQSMGGLKDPNIDKDTAQDFIIRDIETVATKRMANGLAGKFIREGIPKKAVDEHLDKILNIEERLRNKEVKLSKKDRESLTANLEKLYSDLNDSLAKHGNRNLDDYVGLHFIGSWWEEGSPWNDRSRKFGWERYIGSDLMNRYVDQVHTLYNSIMKDKPNATTIQQTQNIADDTKAVAGVEDSKPSAMEESTRETRKEQRRQLEIKAQEEMLEKMTHNPDADTKREIRKAALAMADLKMTSGGIWNMVDFVKGIVQRPELKYYNFDKYPLNKDEAIRLRNAAYAVNMGLKSARKYGNDKMFWNLMYKFSTPLTVTRAFPESRDWYTGTVETFVKAEDRLNIHGTDAQDIINECIKLGNSEVGGNILYSAYIDGRSDTQLKEQYPNLTNSDITKLRNNIIPKYATLMSKLHMVLSEGYNYYRNNVLNRMKAKGYKPEIIRKVMEKIPEEVGKVEKYWPRYILNIDEIVQAKAEAMLEAIDNGTLKIDEIEHGFGFMHARKRKDSDLPEERDISKVLNTYIPKTVLWTRNQKLQFFTDKFMKEFTAKTLASKGTINENTYKAALKYFTKLANDTIKPMDRTLGNNITRALLGFSFSKNIGWSTGSAIRNMFQMIPGTVNSLKFDGYSYHKFRQSQFYDEKGNLITGEDLLNNAAKQAGLTYTQVQGEAGDRIDVPEAMDRLYELMEDKYGNKLSKTKRWTTQKADELANLMFKISGWGAEGKIATIKGKDIKLPQFITFGGVENINRNYTFKRGYALKYKYWYDYYRDRTTLKDSEISTLAHDKAMKSGQELNDLTQFDYHKYNTPEIMRMTGFKGNTLKLALQFKKYTIGLYRMYKEMLLNAASEAKYGEGWNKVLNESAGRVATLMAVHAGIAGLGRWSTLTLYNYVQDDMASGMMDLFYWVFGKEDKMNYYAKKETPFPYQMGPTFGPMASLGLTLANMNELTMNEWAYNNLAPRGPKKVVKAAKMIEQGRPETGLGTLVGIYRDWDAVKRRSKKKSGR